MRRKNRRQRRLYAESLESREMLSADIRLEHRAHYQDVLVVEGTDEADEITVNEVIQTQNYTVVNPRNGQVFTYSVSELKIVVNVRDDAGAVLTWDVFDPEEIDRIEIFAHGHSDHVFNNTSIPSSIWGGDGWDLLVGGSAADYIVGGDGADTIFGRGGNDVLKVGVNAGSTGLRSVTFGGEGNDVLYGTTTHSTDTDVLVGGSGNDQIFAYGGDDLIYGDKFEENWWPTHSKRMRDEAIDLGLHVDDHGNDGADIIWASTGNDQVLAGGGDDTIYGGSGVDLIYAGSGDDKVFGGSEGDYIYGDAGEDELHGQRGNDFIFGGDDDDFIAGGHGWDFMFGDDGLDTILFTLEDPSVDGLPGWSFFRYAFKSGDIVTGEYAGHMVWQEQASEVDIS